MISRRDAVKFGAAGLAAPSVTAAQGIPAPFQPVSTPQPEATPEPVPTEVQMYRGNAGRTGEMPGPAPSMDNPIFLKWQFSTNESIYSSPAVANGTVFVGSDDDNLYAIDAATGQERWRFSTGGDVDSSPAVMDGTVYFGSFDGNIYALDAASGSERWRFETREPDQRFVPAVADGTVVVKGNDLYALDAASGEERWRSGIGGDASAPAVANGTVFVCGENVYAIDLASGEERWRYGIVDSLYTAPVVANETVFVQGGDSFIHAIAVDTGEERWRFQTGGGFAPVISNGIVFAATQNSAFLALDAVTGEERWRFTVESTTYNGSPVVVGDTVFVLSATQILYAIDAAAGTELWRIPVGIETTSATIPAIIDGTLYVGALNGEVYAIHNPKPSVLAVDVTLRGAPSPIGVERGTATAGDVLAQLGTREESAGVTWIQVTIGGATGWIPLDTIDPATLPGEGSFDLRLWFD